MRILIVDDDMASRLLMKKMLDVIGRCDFAVNGREAVELHAAAIEAGDPFTLVLMDLVMPELDGLAALKAIRAKEDAVALLPSRAARIVITSALRNPEDVVNAHREYCDGYLMKPISRDMLTGMIRDLDLLGGGNV